MVDEGVAACVNVLCISSGAIVGALLRYSLDLLAKFLQLAPFHIIFVNVLGSFLIGVVYSKQSLQLIDLNTSLFLSVGFCSSFTTFSSYALQAVLLLEKSSFWQFVLFFTLNNSLCLLAAFVAKEYV